MPWRAPSKTRSPGSQMIRLGVCPVRLARHVKKKNSNNNKRGAYFELTIMEEGPRRSKRERKQTQSFYVDAEKEEEAKEKTPSKKR